MGRDAHNLRRVLGLSSTLPPDWSAHPAFVPRSPQIPRGPQDRGAAQHEHTQHGDITSRSSHEVNGIQGNDSTIVIVTDDTGGASATLPEATQQPATPPSASTPPNPPSHSPASQTPTTYTTPLPTHTIAYNRLYDIKGRPTAPSIRDIDHQRCEAMNFVMGLSVEWVAEQQLGQQQQQDLGNAGSGSEEGVEWEREREERRRMEVGRNRGSES